MSRFGWMKSEKILKPLSLVVWVFLVIVCAALFASAISLRFAELSTAASSSERAVHQLTPAQAHIFSQVGISTTAYAGYNLIFEILQAIFFVGAGVLIMWRRPADRMAWFVSLLLVIMGVGYPPTASVLPGRLAVAVLGLGPSLLIVFLYVFPNGRFVPRWSVWLAGISAVYALAMAISGQPIFSWPTNLHILGTVLCFAPGIASQVYRYRRESRDVERLQTKWVVYALVIGFLALATNAVMRLLLRMYDNPAGWHLAYNLMVAVPFLETVLPAFFPVSIALSVLRFRLWDINLVVNKSLVYGLLTVGLALVFALVVWGVQAVFVFWLGIPQPYLPLLVSVAFLLALYRPLYQKVRFLVDQRLFGFRFSLDKAEISPRRPVIKNPGALSGSKIGEYEVLDLLGKGGMGEVYRGDGQGCSVAIKVLPTDLSPDDVFRQRMQREARALSMLDHPNIIHCYEQGEQQGRFYLVMDFIEGQNLSNWLEQRGTFSLEDLRPIAEKLASALEYAHERGVVHRDIKPSNIMIRAGDNEPILMDFGIALSEQDEATELPVSLAGTVDYMAPEQILMSKLIDQRVDVYALGVMVFELLAGKRPFQGDTSRIIFGHLQQPPPELSRYRPDLPAQISYALRQALAKNPQERFRSTLELVDALYN